MVMNNTTWLNNPHSFAAKCLAKPIHSQCFLLSLCYQLSVTFLTAAVPSASAFFFQLQLSSWYIGRAQNLSPCCIKAFAPSSLLCFIRFVCPEGSSSPHFPSNACPPGTVGNDFNLFDKSQCETCPAGFFCVRGRWLYDKVNSTLYLVPWSSPVSTRAGRWGITVLVNGENGVCRV